MEYRWEITRRRSPEGSRRTGSVRWSAAEYGVVQTTMFYLNNIVVEHKCIRMVLNRFDNIVVREWKCIRIFFDYFIITSAVVGPLNVQCCYAYGFQFYLRLKTVRLIHFDSTQEFKHFFRYYLFEWLWLKTIRIIMFSK